jgi:hypothetical protein
MSKRDELEQKVIDGMHIHISTIARTATDDEDPVTSNITSITVFPEALLIEAIEPESKERGIRMVIRIDASILAPVFDILLPLKTRR